MTDKSISAKNPRLLKILEIECDYQRHKARLLKIETTKTNPRRNSCIEGVNNYRKSKFISDMFKAKDKHDKLIKQNSLIHDTLRKVYMRKSSTSSLHNLNKSQSQNSLIMTKRSSVPSRQRDRNISLQNVRLRNKLILTKSNLSKKKLMVDSKLNKTMEQERITTNANRRRHELAKIMIRNHTKPAVPSFLLPKIKIKRGYSTSLN